MMKLKIFSDQDYVPKESFFEPILYPFWGKPVIDSSLPFRGYYPNYIDFDPYIHHADNIFELSSAKASDAIVIPNNWANWEEIQKPDPKIETPKNHLSIKFFEKNEPLNKPFISFFGSDFSHSYDLPVPSDLVFRTCLLKRNRRKSDFTMPWFCEDFLSTHFNGQMQPRQKSAKPVIGFDGYVPDLTLKNLLKKLAYRLEKATFDPISSRFNVGHLSRMEVIPGLLKSPLVTANFSIRKSPFFNLHDLKKQKPLRVQYVENMFASDYIICPRGVGPISVRFYEALACGRIPVFVNSNTVLPYDFAVDWKQYCVWVEESEIPHIDRKIAEFHDRLSPQDFIDLQYECRKVWKEWCSVEGFFGNLYRHLELIG